MIDVIAIDADDRVSAGLRRLLQQAGYRVSTYADVASALMSKDLYEAKVFLVDAALTTKSGDDVKTALATDPRLKMVPVIGLKKPIQPAELLALVVPILGGSMEGTRDRSRIPERRSEDRFEARISLTIQHADERWTAETESVSADGMFIRCEHMPDVGSLIALAVTLDPVSVPVILQAAVIHQGVGGFGAALSEDDTSDRELWRRWLRGKLGQGAGTEHRLLLIGFNQASLRELRRLIGLFSRHTITLVPFTSVADAAKTLHANESLKKHLALVDLRPSRRGPVAPAELVQLGELTDEGLKWLAVGDEGQAPPLGVELVEVAHDHGLLRRVAAILEVPIRAEARVPTEAAATLYLATQTITARVVEISLGGARLEGEVAPPAGTKVVFNFVLPGQRISVEGAAEVRWVSGAQGSVARFGLAFGALDEACVRALEDYVVSQKA